MSFLKPSEKTMGTLGNLAGPASFAGEAIDQFLGQPGRFGHVSKGAKAGAGALKGAAMGAKLGPIGAAAGAVVGGALGLLAARKANREANNNQASFERSELIAASAGNENPYGEENSGWYKKGGPLDIRKPAPFNPISGYIQQLSSTDFKAKGPSHKKGGMYLPEFGAEIEGEETIGHPDGRPYVFSHYLKIPGTNISFAKEHTRIAKRKRLAESYGSPQSRETVKQLFKRENQLKQLQEMVNG